MYYPDKPRSVSAATGVLTGLTVLLAVSLVVGWLRGGIALVPSLIVIAIAVLTGIGAGRTSVARGWAIAGGWVSIVLALLLLVLIPAMRDAMYYPGSKTLVTWALLAAGAVYGGLGVTAVALLSSPTARRYYREYAEPTAQPR